MTKGKTIWGSTRYYIDIEPDTNHFSTSMSGRVAFYDNRGLLNEESCENLYELVRAVFEFWSTILAPHETRVARWIEEFLSEKGIPSDYNLILRLLKAEELLEKPIEDLILETTKIEKSLYEEKWEIEEDTNIIGKDIKVEKIPEDEYAKREFIQKLIDDNRYIVPQKTKSFNQFKTSNGELKAVEKENNIDVGETIGDYSVSSELINEFDSTISDIQIRDHLPYCFKVENIKLQGAEVNPLKKREDDYLEIIWEIPKLEPKKKIEAKYKLKRKINRTILETRDNKVVTTLNTFESINSMGLDFVANTKYLNVHNKPIEELYIIDDIPPEFSIIRSNPDVIPPTGVVEKAKLKGTTVRWKHKNINTGQILEKNCQLDYFPYLFRNKKIVENNQGEEILKIAKFIFSVESDTGYKIIYIIKNLQKEEEVMSIEDIIPKTHVVTSMEPEDIQMVEAPNDEETKLITIVMSLPEKNMQKKVVLNINGDTGPIFETFKIYKGETKEIEVLEKETNTVREMLKLPEIK